MSTAEDAARALLRQGESANTRMSYGSAMRYWCAWYAARYGHALALPVPVPVVVQFIVDHAARRHEDGDADGGADGSAQDNGMPDEAGQTRHREPPPVGPRRKASALVSELPAGRRPGAGEERLQGAPRVAGLEHPHPPHRAAVQGASGWPTRGPPDR